MSQYVNSYEKKSVLHIELNRVDKKNALTSDMYLALANIFSAANQSDSIKVIFFKGADGCFCAGNDIADFLKPETVSEDGNIIKFLYALAENKKPLVAAVSGPAVGIGTTLLLHCDLVYATDKTLFSLPFINLGLCPEAASSYLLPKQIGRLRASELLLLGDSFDAKKALDYGIINEVVDSNGYWQYAETIAEKLAKKPLPALMATKKLMMESPEHIKSVIKKEIKDFSALLETDEAKAIFQSFLARS